MPWPEPLHYKRDLKRAIANGEVPPHVSLCPSCHWETNERGRICARCCRWRALFVLALPVALFPALAYFVLLDLWRLVRTLAWCRYLSTGRPPKYYMREMRSSLGARSGDED